MTYLRSNAPWWRPSLQLARILTAVVESQLGTPESSALSSTCGVVTVPMTHSLASMCVHGAGDAEEGRD